MKRRNSFGSIGGERSPCRLANAAPEGWPRPRDAGRHRVDFHILIARHPARVGERPRDSNDVRDLFPGRGISGGGLPQPARYVREQAQGVLLGWDVPPQEEPAEGFSRRSAWSGCGSACPPRAIVWIAGAAQGLRRPKTAGGVQRDVGFLGPSIPSTSRNCQFSGVGGLHWPDRVPSQFARAHCYGTRRSRPASSTTSTTALCSPSPSPRLRRGDAACGRSRARPSKGYPSMGVCLLRGGEDVGGLGPRDRASRREEDPPGGDKSSSPTSGIPRKRLPVLFVRYNPRSLP